jgi:putative addiction module component (TIGR02574 family)
MAARLLLEKARALSVGERIELVADIWDSINETSEPPVTEAQRDELRRRIAYYDAHPDERGISLAEIKAKLGVLINE